LQQKIQILEQIINNNNNNNSLRKLSFEEDTDNNKVKVDLNKFFADIKMDESVYIETSNNPNTESSNNESDIKSISNKDQDNLEIKKNKDIDLKDIIVESSVEVKNNKSNKNIIVEKSNPINQKEKNNNIGSSLMERLFGKRK